MAKKGQDGTKLPRAPMDRRRYHMPPEYKGLDQAIALHREAFQSFYRKGKPA